MYWFGFAVVAYFTAVLQTTVAPHVRFQDCSADLLLILALHYALQAPQNEAPLSCWILGLLADICNPGVLGPSALAFGLVGTGLVRSRALVFREQPVPQLLVALVACSAVHLFVNLVAMMKGGELTFIGAVGDALLVAGYTALLTPFIHFAMRWADRFLGMSPARSR